MGDTKWRRRPIVAASANARNGHPRRLSPGWSNEPRARRVCARAQLPALAPRPQPLVMITSPNERLSNTAAPATIPTPRCTRQVQRASGKSARVPSICGAKKAGRRDRDVWRPATDPVRMQSRRESVCPPSPSVSDSADTSTPPEEGRRGADRCFGFGWTHAAPCLWRSAAKLCTRGESFSGRWRGKLGGRSRVYGSLCSSWTGASGGPMCHLRRPQCELEIRAWLIGRCGVPSTTRWARALGGTVSPPTTWSISQQWRKGNTSKPGHCWMVLITFLIQATP